MKKIFVFAVLLVVIGVLCAVFFTQSKTSTTSDEKPWTVGDATTQPSTEAESTTQAQADAVSAFSDYVHETLRESYAFLSEGVSYTQAELQNVMLGAYIYDVDGDGTEDLTVVCAREDGVWLDLYRYEKEKVSYADSMQLRLDPMNEVDFSLDLENFSHIEARLTIYPDGAKRYFCLTVEQSDKFGDYNAYTVVFSYSGGKLSTRKSYRLRQRADVVTLMCTDNVTLLYRQAADASTTETAEGVSVAKYSDLSEAFKTEFAKIGLTVPLVKIENGELKQYKVTPVEHEQNVFDLQADSSLKLTENGFLESFILVN